MAKVNAKMKITSTDSSASSEVAVTAVPVTAAERRMVPLNRIIAWPLNPRRSRSTQAVDDMHRNMTEGMAIGTIRQLVSLIVAPIPGTDLFFAIDGETRHIAMNVAADAGEVAPDIHVDALVLAAGLDDATLIEISTSANNTRTQMDPMDEYEAYVAMVRGGLGETAIAARFNVDEKIVRQRLALGRLVDPARELVRAKRRDVNWAQAMTLGDPARQTAICDEIAVNDASHRTAVDVKQVLTKGRIPVANALFDPKLLADCIVTDLFDPNGGFFTDAGRFWKAQRDAVNDTATNLAESHSKVRVLGIGERFDDAGWTTAGDGVDSADATAVITINDDGTVTTRTGLIAPAHEAGNLARDEHCALLGLGMQAEEALTDGAMAAAVSASALDSVTASTVSYLGAQATASLRTKVAADHRLAMAMLIASVLTRHGPIDNLPRPPADRLAATERTSPAYRAVQTLRAARDAIAVRLDLLTNAEPSVIVERLLASADGDLETLFAWTVAEMTQVKLDTQGAGLCLAAGTEPMAGWSIERAYLQDLTIQQVREVASEVITDQSNLTIRSNRTAIVAAILTQVAGEEAGTTDGCAREWQPPQAAAFFSRGANANDTATDDSEPDLPLV